MNKSIYTEYANLTPYHTKWLDECGAKWAGTKETFGEFTGVNEPFIEYSLSFNGFVQCNDTAKSGNLIHLPTGDAFCRGVAEILGIEYVPEKPFTRKLINKLELHDKMERPLPEGTISKTETVTDDKGLAIDVKLLSEKDREWLKLNAGKMQKVSNAIYGAEKYQEYVCYLNDLELANCSDPENFGYAEKEFYESKGVCITTDPTEFIRYVANKTGKEWGEKPMFGKNQIEIDLDEQLFPGRQNMGEGALTNEDVMELLGDKVGYGSYKTYRVLDSLDGVPFDTRIPLSEWVPPIGKRVLVISESLQFMGAFQTVERGICFQEDNGSIHCFIDHGHWMRIV